MTLIARLCALCAVCTLLQMALEEDRQTGVRMIGGLLMLHLVVSGVRDTAAEILSSGDLMRMFEILMK